MTSQKNIKQEINRLYYNKLDGRGTMCANKGDFVREKQYNNCRQREKCEGSRTYIRIRHGEMCSRKLSTTFPIDDCIREEVSVVQSHNLQQKSHVESHDLQRKCHVVNRDHQRIIRYYVVIVDLLSFVFNKGKVIIFFCFIARHGVGDHGTHKCMPYLLKAKFLILLSLLIPVLPTTYTSS